MATATRTRAEHESRLLEEKRRAERGKNLIVLILHHLTQSGYTGSVEALQAESGVTQAQYEIADNIELIQVLQEFEDYYELRFARKPTLVKKLSKFSAAVDGPTGAARGAAAARGGPGKENGVHGQRTDPGSGAGGGLDPTSLVVSGQQPGKALTRSQSEGDDPWEHRIRKAGLPPAMAANAELRELAGWLQRDMIQTNPNVRWGDVAGSDGVKRVLKESLVMPLRYPEYFTGLLQPWKGVLLYGPPGTGKTLLAKAVATECNTTFFNISASSIVSKWRGDSEKLVRVLFELARHHAPSTIFVDEIDALMSARGDAGEHEGSRRMKTELLVQMDGLLASSEQVFLLAATNLPWELDMALLRRLEKRVLVPYPTPEARSSILKRVLPADRLAKNASLDEIAMRTEGYSGSDLVLVAKEAAMRPLRRLLATLDLDAPSGRALVTPPKPGPVSAEDLDAALSATRPTVHAAERYAKWDAEFGST
ncbi:katanin p60 ATPase-containing subunit a-like 2-like protein [Chrysochromulina tobinii]|uniref:Katanin p60 ATPase-containing subunit a-like 2-like protein n=1 Tax=Chrysochromulina tobinii TaxID=1460289 RepID=A0A0M0JIG9_9EUKA|nr:katanin p60 ATPase-containing subunit a-like 2-like protein [Chrysochromulina tobinii]|eukprot:KOO26406.1 katanin p60 ATPase-containing subunit a-like 2-like protein [Chrysochromulina sp. CCMP291]